MLGYTLLSERYCEKSSTRNEQIFRGYLYLGNNAKNLTDGGYG